MGLDASELGVGGWRAENGPGSGKGAAPLGTATGLAPAALAAFRLWLPKSLWTLPSSRKGTTRMQDGSFEVQA